MKLNWVKRQVFDQDGCRGFLWRSLAAGKLRCLPFEKLAIPLLLLALTCLFLYKNVLGFRPAIPFDLLYNFAPWKSHPPSAVPIRQNPELFDQIAQFYPWSKLAVEELRNWRLPLWNPYSFCGSPLLANGQSGIFYPFHLLNIILTLPTASIVLSYTKLLLAGIFTWAFLRRIGASTGASSFGAVVFAFSRNIIVWLGFPAADAAVLLPGLFWAFERLAVCGDMKSLCIAAILVGVQFLAGQPQTSIVSFLCLSIYIVLRMAARKESSRHKLRIIGMFLAAWVLGAAVAAVQILPMVEYARQSAAFAFRSHLNLKVYPWYELVSFAIPDFFGTPYDGNYWGFANLLGTACYVGVAPLLLALVSLFSVGKRRDLRPFWIISIVCAGIIYKLPILGKITSLPLFNMIDTNKFLVGIVFSLAVCAALELDLILKEEETRIGAKGIAASTALIVLGLAVFLRLREYTVALKLQSYEIINFTIFLAFVAATLILFRAQRHSGFRGRFLSGFFVSLAFADLFLFGHAFNSALPREAMPSEPTAIKELKTRVGPYRVLGVGSTMPPNTSLIYRLPDMRGYDAMTPMRYFRFLASVHPDYANYLSVLDLRTVDGPITASTLFRREAGRMLASREGRELAKLMREAYYWNSNLEPFLGSSILDAFSVKYVLADPEVRTLPRTNFRLVQAGVISVFENPDAIPRCYIARNATITDENTALRTVTRQGFNFRDEVLISSAVHQGLLEQPTHSLGSRKASPDDHAEMVRETPSLVQISAHTGGPSYLVLGDLFYPGWVAYVDGERVPVYSANYLFRAVRLLRAGDHSVRFEYRPGTVLVGASISTVAVLMVGIMLVVFGTISRRRLQAAAV
jgi:hypothetical protein